MAIFRDSTPDSPMYREVPQSYSPHWARPFRPNRASQRAAKSAAGSQKPLTPPSLRRPPKP
jgi:hypothetical protein